MSTASRIAHVIDADAVDPWSAAVPRQTRGEGHLALSRILHAPYQLQAPPGVGDAARSSTANDNQYWEGSCFDGHLGVYRRD